MGSPFLRHIESAHAYIMGASIAVCSTLCIVRIISIYIIDRFFDLSFTRPVSILYGRHLFTDRFPFTMILPVLLIPRYILSFFCYAAVFVMDRAIVILIIDLRCRHDRDHSIYVLRLSVIVRKFHRIHDLLDRVHGHSIRCESDLVCLCLYLSRTMFAVCHDRCFAFSKFSFPNRITVKVPFKLICNLSNQACIPSISLAILHTDCCKFSANTESFIIGKHIDIY